MIIFCAISAAINFLTSIIVCIIAVLRNPKLKLNRSFGYFSFSVAAWSVCYFMWQISRTADSALFWSRVLMFGAIFIPPTFFHLSVNLIDQYNKYKNGIYIWYVSSMLFCSLNLTPLFVKNVLPRMGFQFWPTAGITYSLFLLFFVALVVYAHILLFRFMRESVGYKRNQIKYIFLGTAIGFAGGLTNYPLWYDINIPPIGNILVSVYVFLVFYAIIKFQLLDIRIAVTKGGIFLVVFALILGIPFWLGHSMLYSMPFWYIPIGLMALLASLGPLIYRKLDAKAEDIILAEQRRYQRILVQAANGMTNERNLERLLKLIVYVICKTVNVEFAAIFLIEKDSGMYKLRAIRDHKSVSVNTVVPENDPVIKLLNNQKENSENNINEKAGELMQKYINKPIGLVVPAFMNEKLIGMLVLGEKRNKKMYNQDDINVFRILTDQASLAIANCFYMDEVKKSQEQLFQAEKLANVGGMAEGVAHQIKNRLNSFSMAAGEQDYELAEIENNYREILDANPGLKDSITYIKAAAKSVIENVGKVNGIITGILNYARIENKEALFLENDILKMLDAVKEWVRIKHELGELPLILDIKNDGKLYGVETQLTEAIFNMVDNSYEAIKEKTDALKVAGKINGYKPEILFSMFDNPVEKATVIRIADNGIGIKDDVRKKIFAPFFTTKPSSKSGSGIGMYIVRRMIEENHRGKIWFNSKYNEGTEVFIKLPRKGALQ